MLYSKKVCVLVISVLVLLLVLLRVFQSDMKDYKENIPKIVHTVQKRQVHLEDKISKTNVTTKLLLLPNDTVIDGLGETEMSDLYWRYINTLQVLCNNQTRLGSLRDGGKEICFDDAYRPGYPCLVYSFGSNFQFDFEIAVMNHFRCEIHTFDPSHPVTKKVPAGIAFHLTGLDNHTHVNNQHWQMDTLSNIRKSLDHEKKAIDILKIDIEGAEWTALPQMFTSGVLKDVRQLSIEMHFGKISERESRPWGDVNPKDQLKVLRALYEQGFLIFMHEHNLFSVTPFSKSFPEITTVNEISLLNMNYVNRVH